MSRHHHLFIASPASGALGAQVARSLASGQAQLAKAGYGEAVLGPHRSGQIHLDAKLIGDVSCGLFSFFEQAGKNAMRFARRLDAPIGRVVIQTLPYDQYYPMMWRHMATGRALKPFEGAVARLMERPRGWAQVIADLHAALAPQEIVVLPAPVLVEEALAALVPGARLDPRTPPQLDRPDSAIAMLQRLHRANVTLDPHQIQRLAAFHARQPQGAPLAAFNAIDSVKLRKRYAQDMDQIAAMARTRIGADLDFAIAAQ
ncbi:hypothetical protein [uncultured Thioclava sp.]|uniref:hypothetical protein n=1 Tax=uncultured Thioclava sp. TaxID=473858 RepID=UPI0025D1B6AB|nr:hypothetical protein [uncultured Thioclava sp.]